MYTFLFLFLVVHKRNNYACSFFHTIMYLKPLPFQWVGSHLWIGFAMFPKVSCVEDLGPI
jgi:hypothetical protein